MKILDYVMAVTSYFGLFSFSMHMMWIFTSMDILEMIILAATGSLIAYIPLGLKIDQQEKEKI